MLVELQMSLANFVEGTELLIIEIDSSSPSFTKTRGWLDECANAINSLRLAEL